MPMGGYNSQVAPGGTPAYAGATAEQFGAGLGVALENVGEAVDRLKERHQQDQAASAGLQFAKDSGDIDTIAQQQRDSNPNPGAAGHTDAVIGELDKRAQASLGQITDRRVRQVYEQQYAELRTRVHGREDAWESGQRIDRQVSDFDQAGTQLANNQATAPTADGFAEGLTAIDRQAHLQIPNADLANKAALEQKRKLATAWGNAMVRTDRPTLSAVLDKGLLNPYLEPKDIESLRSGIQVEDRHDAAEARAKAAQAEAQTRESLTNFGHRIELGDQPSDAEFAQMEKAATTLPDQGGKLFDVQAWHSQVQINRETRDWTPAQFNLELNNLRAKGDKRTTAENIQLKQLETIAPSRVSAFNSDPQGWAANSGAPAPGLDHPQELVAWARSLRKSAGLGYTPYLSEAQAQPLKERIASGGPAGVVEVAGELRNTFQDAGVAGEIARQWGNKDLELLVGLQTSTAAMVARGASVISRNPKLVSDPDNADTFNRVFDDVAGAIPADLRTPVFNAAKRIWAAKADEVHADGPSDSGFRSAISAAMGRAGGAGGLGEFRGKRLWLAPGMAQGDFETRLARANIHELDQAAGGSPPFYTGTNGKPTTAIDFRAHPETRLETVAPGVYRLLDARGHAFVDKAGKPWLLDTGKLP